MAQQMNQGHAKSRSSIMITLKIARPLRRQVKAQATQKEDEEFLQTLKAVGMPEDAIPGMVTLIDGMRKARKNTKKENYRSDKIFVAGIAVLNLILLQILTTISGPDFASYLSWVFFALSLPCVGGFLYMSLLQERDESYLYSPVHEWLASIAVISGAISTIALVWHFWIVAGIILLITSLLIFVITTLFRFFNDADYANTLRIIVNETTGNTPNEEN